MKRWWHFQAVQENASHDADHQSINMKIYKDDLTVNDGFAVNTCPCVGRNILFCSKAVYTRGFRIQGA